MKTTQRIVAKETHDLLGVYRTHVSQEFADTLSDELAGLQDLPAAIEELEAANGIAINPTQYELTIHQACLPCLLTIGPPPFASLECFEYWDDAGQQWLEVPTTIYRVDPPQPFATYPQLGIIRLVGDAWPDVKCDSQNCCPCECFRLKYTAGYPTGGPASQFIPASLLKAICMTAEALAGKADKETQQAIHALRQPTRRMTYHSYLN